MGVLLLAGKVSASESFSDLYGTPWLETHI